jgi:hypothetical protein
MQSEEKYASEKRGSTFKDDQNIEEYKEEICQCLICSSWHYSREDALDHIKDNEDYVRKCYEKKIPADECSAEVGYCCG